MNEPQVCKSYNIFELELFFPVAKKELPKFIMYVRNIK